MPPSDADFAPAQTTSRPLGALENLFASYEQEDAMTYVMVAELPSIASRRDVESALDAVQSRHPSLQVRLGIDDQRRLAFLPCGARVQLETVDAAEIDLATEISRALDRTFEADDGPLVRVVAASTPDRTSLLFVFHHAIADAKVATQIVRETIALLEGQGPGAAWSFRSVDDAVGYVMPEQSRDLIRIRRREEPTSVSMTELDQDLTARLLRVAKAEGVTLNALVVSLVGAAHDAPADGSALRIMTPVDLRTQLDAAGSDGVFLTIAVTSHTPGVDRIAYARDVVAQARAAREPARVAGFVSAIGSRLTSGPDHEAIRNQLIEHVPYDVVVTNLGEIASAGSGANTSCGRIFGPFLQPFVGHEVVSLSTYEGRLSVMHTRRGPSDRSFERLIGMVHRIGAAVRE